MNKLIDDIKQIRGVMLKSVSGLSPAQLNKIPEGFNNNIIWNLGHLVASQQGLCYFRSGLAMPVGQDYFNRYKADTKPEGEVSEAQIDTIKSLLISTLEGFKIDFSHDLFADYQSFTSRYGVELSNINEALKFVLFHEGIHFGYIMALKRLV